jgi:phospholipid/cholesterol/gamma-HCH transport system substrate-binding protein
MQKQAPSPGRILTMLGFALSCFGLLLFLWLSFGGSVPLKPKGYRFDVAFPEATQLAQQADVRIAGVSVGKVVSKRLDSQSNRTVATIEMQRRFAPVRRDTHAILRQKTLLGETYVELIPGPPRSPPLPDGGLLARNRVVSTVELDEILNALDPKTRQAFRTWQQSLSGALRGNGQSLNDVLGNLPSFATDGDALLKVLDVQHTALRGLVRDTGTVFGALSQDQGQLRNLVTSSAAVFSQTARQQKALADTITVFPVFLDESKATLARLKAFALDTDPLVQQLRPAIQDLAPTLHDVRLLAPDLRTLFRRLDPLIAASKAGLPAVRDVLNGATPLLGQLAPFLEQLNPVLSYIAQYQHQTADFISQGAGGLAGKTASVSGGNGHYLRQFQPLGAESVGLYPFRNPANRGNTYLPPLFSADTEAARHQIFPNWDCTNAGGARMPAAGVGPLLGMPGCFTEALPHVSGDNGKLPHVLAANYPKG